LRWSRNEGQCGVATGIGVVIIGIVGAGQEIKTPLFQRVTGRV
jgi:hypothetical protein